MSVSNKVHLFQWVFVQRNINIMINHCHFCNVKSWMPSDKNEYLDFIKNCKHASGIKMSTRLGGVVHVLILLGGGSRESKTDKKLVAC